MRLQLGDPGVFCALIGQSLLCQQDGAKAKMHRPLQVLHASATDTAIAIAIRRHSVTNSDALNDTAEPSSNHTKLPTPSGISTGYKPKIVRMTEQNPPKSAGAGDAAAGIPFYEKQRQHLKELIARKRTLEKRLVRTTPGDYESPAPCARKQQCQIVLTAKCNRLRRRTQSTRRRRNTSRPRPRGILSWDSTTTPRARAPRLLRGARLA